ncbi:MAG: hypothetical protein Q8K11_01155 [Phenylobacterium sp.]|uniref:hypothetical protein n=1 Tax=Phenylobacterium sp. TaxID=1871053 RepID=UPI00272F4F30|nr:hypothetical protein [Phenylobacterium sp.]MDP2008760.1 hypothetical protein [Phenylobacterium sp.]MDP3867153.1 hypothetical protein [Phenylobacterium sp.]HQT52216.1 hypothetical protein [Phenylobacterium sp.]
MDYTVNVDPPGVTDPHVLYQYRLGLFHSLWATVDVTVDFLIGKLLKLPDADAHMITWGMMFGPKAKLLATLIKLSDHPNKQALMTALNIIRAGKRDVITHGYQLENEGGVAFLERSRSSQDFQTKLHEFTRDGFRDHVNGLVGASNSFFEASGAKAEDIQAFVDAAGSLAKKS